MQVSYVKYNINFHEWWVCKDLEGGYGILQYNALVTDLKVLTESTAR
jgi:hypothetical protein